MRRMVIDLGQVTVRWSGGSFIAAWRNERRDQQVPDWMITMPENMVVSRASAKDIERISREWFARAA